MPKKYSGAVDYEKKLSQVMQRIGAEKYNYDWSRSECWIEFYIDGQMYRFEHSLKKSEESGNKLSFVSDCFAQLVLALEDIARLSERGIYKLQSWIEGMKALPDIPMCFKALGFDSDEVDEGEVKARYRALAMLMHPDKGGDDRAFVELTRNYEQCLQRLENKI